VADVIIRSYRPGDEAAVEAITYRTGFKGEDLTGRGFVSDRWLCFLTSIYYYVRYEPAHFFVAVDTGKDAVVGFIGGTTDTGTQEKNFAKKIIPRIALRMFLFTIWRYPSSFWTLMKMTRMLGSLGDRKTIVAAIQSEYPAHLHINLLPEYQGQGVGTRLMRHFEAHLIDQGLKGVHLNTTNHNRKAVPFYHKMGFTVVSETEAKSHPVLDDLKLLTFAKKLDTHHQ